MSLADYNTSYILTVLCMLIVDNLMIRRLSKGNYLGNRQRWVNIMLIVSGICAFSDIMCILISGVKYKFPVFFFNAVFDLAFTMVAFFLFYRMEKEIDSKLFNKKWFKHIVFIPVVLTLIFLVLSYPFGLIFSVDSLGNYTRGHYIVSSILCWQMVILYLLLLVIHLDILVLVMIERKEFFIIQLFTIYLL